MNKQVVSIEVLKSYFETGKKPTQGQFGALIDSFYHKNETIPQSQIEGLDKTLEAKAETTDLDIKANLNAGNLTAKNIEQWKEVLGVGDVPENMATIDQDDEQGNAYTKEQVDDLLKNINTENISNTDLNLEPGTVRTFDITGAKFQMKGLQDKQADASFNKKLIVNDNGEFAVKEDGDVIINMPSEVLHTVNHIYPNNVPAQPSYVSELQKVLEQYRNITLIPITKDDLEIKTFESQKLENNKVYDNNTFALSSSGFANAPSEMYLVEMTTKNIVLPADKNWIFKIVVNAITDAYHGGSFYGGIARNKEEPISFGLQGSSYSGISFLKTLYQVSFMRNNNTFIFIKVGDTITILADKIREAKYPRTDHSYDAITALGGFIPKIHLKSGASITGKMFYKILD